ncbi:hypothetical protein N0B51_12935 [Tsuneonella sp. YG55]|uniref:Uncharacterized protein n=1 Tax=Tsuneonella litorea TaxID=2976475 RepID=A0A9X2W350_9SPHN|nr:hypothetical protein [Tsuneonella litorea]MCT2559882.1 hypothetical protein [Tsuneonella litorea]
MNPAVFALAALIPAMAGPLPQEAARDGVLALRLCNGGTVAIPLPSRERKAPASCPQKGCHATCNRKRLDPAQ